MKKYEKDCLIVLKGGILKSYQFSDEFVENNKELVIEFANIWDEFYNNDCCVFGASNTHKDNYDLKIKLCNILDKMFDLNIEIMNGWDDKTYKVKRYSFNNKVGYALDDCFAWREKVILSMIK